MSDKKELIVLAFTDEDKANEVLEKIQQEIEAGQISILNAAVLVKYQDGKTRMKEIQEVGATQGAVFGALMGGLIGSIGGPVGAMVGAVAGATTGGVAAYTIDSGFPDEYLKELKGHLQPDSSAVVILSADEWSEPVIAVVAPFGGYVIRHVLKEEIAAHLATIGIMGSDKLPAADLSANFEAQIAAWQADVEKLIAQADRNGADTEAELRNQLAILHAKQRRAQEKLHELWNNEIHLWTEKIEAPTAKLNAMPVAERAEILAELEACRAKRKVVREKLYSHIELRLKEWQTEIEQLQAKVTEMWPMARARPKPRLVALQRVASAFGETGLPTAQAETSARIVALQARIEAAETELQAQAEEQIAAWQEAIRDLQAYEAIPGAYDQAEVHARIAVLQEQVAVAQARLKAQLEVKIAGWTNEINELRLQAAAVGSAKRARINKQIADLKAQIQELESQATAIGARERINIDTQIAILQDKVATAQAKLKSLEQVMV